MCRYALPILRLRASLFGWYCNSFAASMTLFFVSSVMLMSPSLLLKTRDTVAIDTLARSATSFRVTALVRTSLLPRLRL